MSNFKTFAILDNNGEKLYSTELSPDDFNFMRFFTKGVDSLKNKEKVSLTKTLTKLNESDEFRVQSILVIEDDPTTLKSLMMEIKLKGHYVEGVEDVETASAILKKDPKRFDIILTDNMMPSGESGSSFAKKVKKKILMLWCLSFQEIHLVLIRMFLSMMLMVH